MEIAARDVAVEYHAPKIEILALNHVFAHPPAYDPDDNAHE